MTPALRPQRSPLALGILAAALGLGWSLREAQFAAAQGKRVANGTVNAQDVPMSEAKFEGRKTGQAGVFLDGATAGTRTLQVGRFLLDPGSEPHPPHRHPEEELLLVTRGSGEIFCDGKRTPVRAGAVMFCDPNVEHGIKNTGERPLEFYWIKYVPAAR